MADNDTTLRGFDVLADNLLKPGSGTPKVDDNDDDVPFVDPDDVINPKDDDNDDTDNDDVDTKPDSDDDPDKDKDDDLDDDKDDDADPDDDDDDDDNKEPSDDDPAETAEFESEITKFFQKKFAEELGWDFDEEESLDTIGDLVEYMEGIVTEASKPIYANEEVGKIDEFIKQGGKLEDYYKAIDTGGIDLNSADISKESTQKAVIEEHLKNIGYSEERIKRSLDRYEDRGVLEEEAEDALELLKEYKEKNKEKLLENQKKVQADQLKQQQKFVENVEKDIQDLSDIAGYKLNSKEKQELSDYIFKPTKDGRTQYQIDYASDQEKNLIESAFFTKNKDKLVSNAKKQASSETLKEMQQRLKSKGKRGKNSGSRSDGKKGSVDLSVLGRQLMKQ